jgi:hypothetical protein
LLAVLLSPVLEQEATNVPDLPLDISATTRGHAGSGCIAAHRDV